MRVVAGSAGGRRLHTPPGRRLRPTSERVREAVFASLASRGAIAGAKVLDLFAGTGALGIEALSRGASTATFVDADETAIAMVRANLLRIGFTEHATVVRGDAVRFVEEAADAGHAFDLVLADPPYVFGDWPRLLNRLPTPVAVLESDRPIDPGPGWSAHTRRYGDSVVTLAHRL